MAETTTTTTPAEYKITQLRAPGRGFYGLAMVGLQTVETRLYTTHADALEALEAKAGAKGWELARLRR